MLFPSALPRHATVFFPEEGLSCLRQTYPLFSARSSTLSNQDLDSTLRELRVFPPPEELAAKAHIQSLEQYETLYAVHSGSGSFWAEVAKELHWFAPWDRVLDWKLPRPGGSWAAKSILLQLRRSSRPTATRETKPPLCGKASRARRARLTYGELYLEVQKFANVLKGLGIRKGDRVAVYMGMTPELAIALLACARIGAVHSVIFGGFAANALVDRINDASCVAVITQDRILSPRQEVRLKPIVDEALQQLPHGEACSRLSPHRFGRQHEARPRSMVARPGGQRRRRSARPSRWTQRIRSTSSTLRGPPVSPKGLVHTTGGYSVQTYLTSKTDLRSEATNDVYWCTADIGWVTGHSYVVYGPCRTASPR